MGYLLVLRGWTVSAHANVAHYCNEFPLCVLLVVTYMLLIVITILVVVLAWP